jgi:uncharacterized protein (TIGR02466 family)
MKITSLFPQAISSSKIIDKTQFENLKSYSDLRKNAGNKATKDAYILNNPKYVGLKTELEKILEKHMIEVYDPEDFDNIKIFITQSWVNHTTTGEYHHPHHHTNSVLSGVLYLQVDPKIDGIMFSRSAVDFRPDTLFKFETTRYNSFNSETWNITGLETGDVIVFPSTLTHSVNTREDSSTTRISLAFNSFVKGRLGSYHKYTEVYL